MKKLVISLFLLLVSVSYASATGKYQAIAELMYAVNERELAACMANCQSYSPDVSGNPPISYDYCYGICNGTLTRWIDWAGMGKKLTEERVIGSYELHGIYNCINDAFELGSPSGLCDLLSTGFDKRNNNKT